MIRPKLQASEWHLQLHSSWARTGRNCIFSKGCCRDSRSLELGCRLYLWRWI